MSPSLPTPHPCGAAIPAPPGVPHHPSHVCDRATMRHPHPGNHHCGVCGAGFTTENDHDAHTIPADMLLPMVTCQACGTHMPAQAVRPFEIDGDPDAIGHLCTDTDACLARVNHRQAQGGGVFPGSRQADGPTPGRPFLSKVENTGPEPADGWKWGRDVAAGWYAARVTIGSDVHMVMPGNVTFVYYPLPAGETAPESAPDATRRPGGVPVVVLRTLGRVRAMVADMDRVGRDRRKAYVREVDRLLGEVVNHVCGMAAPDADADPYAGVRDAWADHVAEMRRRADAGHNLAAAMYYTPTEHPWWRGASKGVAEAYDHACRVFGLGVARRSGPRDTGNRGRCLRKVQCGRGYGHDGGCEE